MLAARVTADKAAVVYRIEYLTGPAMSNLLQRRDERAYPFFQTLETLFTVIRFAALVILAPNNDEVVRSMARLQAHIVIGIFRIPVECVRDRPFPDCKSHGVTAVRRHLGVKCE